MSIDRSVAAPSVLLGVVVCCDVGLAAGPAAVPFVGALDEPAHLATAALALLACARWRWLRQRRRQVLTVLAAAVLIDLDHIPLYAGLPHVALGGRPFSHSLATVVVLLTVSCVVPVRTRRWLRAAALGVGLHFVRDVATGPGLLLLWPVTTEEFRLPYAVYAGAVGVLAVVATWRRLRDPRRQGRHLPPVPVPDERPAQDRSTTSSL